MSGIDLGRFTRRVISVAVFLGAASTAPAQTFTWTGGAGSTDWFASGNWNQAGSPGVAGSSGNTDQALFDTAGSTVSAANLNGFSLGAIATTGATGGTLTANFNGNNPLRLNGGYTVGPFTNVAAAAQNGRDLEIVLTNMSFAFGQSGQDTTFYADANRTIIIATQQITNSGNNLNKEGAGTLILGSGPTLQQRDLANRTININGGVVAAHHSFNNVTQINVAGGALIQPGLSNGGDTLSTSSPIIFANNAGLRILTNGTSVNQLQNAALSKAPGDTFRIVLAGLTPIGTETYTPGGIIVQASSLTEFDPNGSYSPTFPGHFSLVGDGFLVTDWKLTVLNTNQIRLDGMTVAPVPEPAWILVASAGLIGLRRRRRIR